MGQGSEQALAQLYGAYAEKVYNTLISYTKNEEDAQELTQDVFLTLFRSASQFRFDSSVSTWVYRIAVNKALDFLRKQNAAKRQGVFTSLFTRSGEVLLEPPDFHHPGIKLEQKEQAALLFRVIDTLPDKQKTAFILTQMEGLPQQEVAQIMETSRKSVESLVQRAKANLKKSLEKYAPERGMRKNKPSN